MNNQEPFSNRVKYIPKGRRGRFEKNQIYPVEHYRVTETDIAAANSGAGGAATSGLVDPNNSPGGGGGGGVSLADLVPLIIEVEPQGDNFVLTDFEPSTNAFVLTTTAGTRNADSGLLQYQWQKSDSGIDGPWNDIPGETNQSFTVPTGLIIADDQDDMYRCVVSHPVCVNSPQYSSSHTINLRRVISIISQPSASPGLDPGDVDSFSVSATITSGAIGYQWQKKEFDGTDFVDIPGATSASYTTGGLFAGLDNGDQYRCVLTNEFADTVISDPAEIAVSGSDVKIVPAVNGISFWSFKDNGSLILDPSDATTYTLTNISTDKTRLAAIMWGQGTCAAQGGYTEGGIPTQFQDTYTIKLNTGGGSAGYSDSGRYAEAGGGYAGIFNGTTVSQTNALMIAGGAGGSSLNTNTCGGSQQSVSYPVTTSYIGTCYTYTSNNGTISHWYNNDFCGDNYLNYGGFSYAYTTGCGSRQYWIFYNTSFQNTNYSISIYPGSCTAARGACPGFYYSYTKYTWGLNISFYRNDNGANSYVGYFSIYTSASYPYSCTQYTTTYYNYTGEAASAGGAGGGQLGSAGSDASNSHISATGGQPGDQSAGGAGGTNTQGYNGTAGLALQGGVGGSNSGNMAASGGGGGGGGFFGGGGGAGGYDYQTSGVNPGRGPSAGGGGGGGSGFYDPSVIDVTTVPFANSTDLDRGSAGSNQQNSRVVIKPSYIQITQQPTSAIANEGSTATFTISAILVTFFTSESINYQWQKKESESTAIWTNIPGATSSSYTTPTLTITNDSTDLYRCILSNQYVETVISDAVSLTVTNPLSLTYYFNNTGDFTISSSQIPPTATDFIFKIWAAGGSGSGEGSVRRGGSGGFATGKITIPTGNTNDVQISVGATANGGPPSPRLGYGYGAAAGGERSSVGFGSAYVIVGGGGGAGQGGHGGYGGGANRIGGPGTGFYPGGGGSLSGGGGGGGSPGGTSAVNGTSGTSGDYGGGQGGGSGLCCGMRGGGGGSGYYGGGGGGGGYNSYDGAGGGGASGYATSGITDLYTLDGFVGSSSGAIVPASNDPDYIQGYGGSSQNGLGFIQFIIGVGEEIFTTYGTYTWTCPAGVTSVCAVCVGAGGRGGGAGGGGGGLGWKNNISVTPGQSYTVVVGRGGQPGAANGGDSYFINTSTVRGGGGKNGWNGGSGGNYTGDGGGNGGSGSAQTTWGGGGGGAGGYSGNGGNANTLYGSSGSGGGGGGGAGHSDTDSNDAKRKGGAGGGVGIYGQGANGAGAPYSGLGGDGGAGGSGGGNGTSSTVHTGGSGGLYGGGSGGTNEAPGGWVSGGYAGEPGGGAVRIIWGSGKSFPNNAAAG